MGAKKGENTGEIGIEGTAIEEPEEVRLLGAGMRSHAGMKWRMHACTREACVAWAWARRPPAASPPWLASLAPAPSTTPPHPAAAAAPAPAAPPPAQGTPSLEALKLLYYQLMTRFHLHEGDYLEVCRCYR